MDDEWYEPYQIGADWYYDSAFKKERGPYVSEEVCKVAAEDTREREQGD